MVVDKQVADILLEPLSRFDSLSIIVNRYCTDVNGTVIDKSTLPAALQVSYPVYVFSEFDRLGAYYLSLKNLPPVVGTFYLCSFVYGINNPLFFGFSGLADITGKLKPGDLVTIYTDDVDAPTFYIWIVQSSPNRPLASIMANLSNLPQESKYGFLRAYALKYYTDNVDQWNETIQYLVTDYIGLIKSNNMDPFIYRKPTSVQNMFVQMELKVVLTQYVGFSTYFKYDTDSINLNFQLKINK